MPQQQGARHLPYVLRVLEDRVRDGLEQVRAVVARFPGTQPLVLVVHMRDGAQVRMDTNMTVDASPALADALLPFRPPAQLPA